MIARTKTWKMFCIAAGTMAAVLAIGWASPRAAAGELEKLDASLKWIPADAAFYSSVMRGREQFDAIAASNAWAKIKELPLVKEGLENYREELKNPGSGPAQFEANLKNPEIRKILDLLIDMASNEVFLYGDSSATDFLELMQNNNRAVNLGRIAELAAVESDELPLTQSQAQILLAALAKTADLIGAPGLVAGFKLKNPDLAKEQLIKLEMMANIILETNETTKGHFKKQKIGDCDYLVLQLDGGMVPWDNMPIDLLRGMEKNEGDADKIVERLQEMTLALALGVRGDYLIFSIGSSLECLEKLGQGDRLVDRPELQRLEPFAGRRLTSIAYVSEDLARQANDPKQSFEQLLDIAEAMLPMAELKEAQEEKILAEAEAFAEDLKRMMPQPGAMCGLSFLTDRGIESYQFDWGRHDRLDAAKRLDLLDHLGGNPLLAVAGRKKVSLDDYNLIVQWVKKGYALFREFALPHMQESERKKATQLLDALEPLAVRTDKANREWLFPALADGQSALVIDGKFTSKQLAEGMPEFVKPMPWLEPAVVLGVSDAKRLKKAVSEYREILNGLFDALRGVEGTDVPDWLRIPEPKEIEGPEGAIYAFPLPEEWGIDKRIVPNIGISEHSAAISASTQHTERLLKPAPLAAGGVLAKTDRPLGLAVWFDWAGLLDAAAPWAEYAVDQVAEEQNFDKEKKQSVADQVQVGLKVLKAIRSLSVETYREDGVLVHHSMVEIRDVEK